MSFQRYVDLWIQLIYLYNYFRVFYLISPFNTFLIYSLRGIYRKKLLCTNFYFSNKSPNPLLYLNKKFFLSNFYQIYLFKNNNNIFKLSFLPRKHFIQRKKFILKFLSHFYLKICLFVYILLFLFFFIYIYICINNYIIENWVLCHLNFFKIIYIYNSFIYILAGLEYFLILFWLNLIIFVIIFFNYFKFYKIINILIWRLQLFIIILFIIILFFYIFNKNNFIFLFFYNLFYNFLYNYFKYDGFFINILFYNIILYNNSFYFYIFIYFYILYYFMLILLIFYYENNMFLYLNNLFKKNSLNFKNIKECNIFIKTIMHPRLYFNWFFYSIFIIWFFYFLILYYFEVLYCNSAYSLYSLITITFNYKNIGDLPFLFKFFLNLILLVPTYFIFFFILFYFYYNNNMFKFILHNFYNLDFKYSYLQIFHLYIFILIIFNIYYLVSSSIFFLNIFLFPMYARVFIFLFIFLFLSMYFFFYFFIIIDSLFVSIINPFFFMFSPRYSKNRIVIKLFKSVNTKLKDLLEISFDLSDYLELERFSLNNFFKFVNKFKYSPPYFKNWKNKYFYLIFINNIYVYKIRKNNFLNILKLNIFFLIPSLKKNFHYQFIVKLEWFDIFFPIIYIRPYIEFNMLISTWPKVLLVFRNIETKQILQTDWILYFHNFSMTYLLKKRKYIFYVD